ncbi:MAG: alpha/beta fold hydrolase [Myxococcaceae bacterium]|nr:alpha/beta fold hydrolase [Myxococcaceae bacterium]
MKTWRPGDVLPGPEVPFYLAHEGEQLAVVQHAAATVQPRATVVLAGPMTLERAHGYLTWVRLARNLALNGYEVLRFDYRGVGESTGEFRAQTFDAWRDDVGAVAAHAKTSGAGRVVLLGLRLGALLCRPIFEEGVVDGLVAWEPPGSGRAMAMDMLRRKLAADYMEFPDAARKTRDDYVKELERGAEVEVEGYPWTTELWRSTERYTFAEPERIGGEWLTVFLDGRPDEKLPAAHRQQYASFKAPRPAFWLQSANLVADLSAPFLFTQERLHQWSNAWSATDGGHP